MRRLGGVIAVAALTLLAGCAQEPESTELSPIAAEEYVQTKLLSDVRSNPSLVLQELREPQVECNRTEPEPDDDVPDDGTLFNCDASVATESGDIEARQTWEIVLEQDQTTGDQIVSRAFRLETSIPRAEAP